MKPIVAILGCFGALALLWAATGPQSPTVERVPVGVLFHIAIEGPELGRAHYSGEGWIFYRFPDEPNGRAYSQHVYWDERGRTWAVLSAPSCDARLEYFVKGSKWLISGVDSAILTCEGLPELWTSEQPVGDALPDNRVSIRDFNKLKTSYGMECGDSQYDYGADATGDCLITILDFYYMRLNFGLVGAWPPF
jgi:hypothetical protein